MLFAVVLTEIVRLKKGDVAHKHQYIISTVIYSACEPCGKKSTGLS